MLDNLVPDLSGKHAVVTGASRGIGEACVRALDAAGARIALVARTTEAMERIAAELRHDPVVITADLASADATLRAADEALGALGAIDLLVNNAASMMTGEPVTGITAAGLDAQFGLNLRNVVVLTSRLGESLLERRGCVVNISSVAAEIAGGNGLGYAMTKGGMNSFTRILGGGVGATRCAGQRRGAGLHRYRHLGASPRAARRGIPRFGGAPHPDGALGAARRNRLRRPVSVLTGGVLHHGPDDQGGRWGSRLVPGVPPPDRLGEPPASVAGCGEHGRAGVEGAQPKLGVLSSNGVSANLAASLSSSSTVQRPSLAIFSMMAHG